MAVRIIAIKMVGGSTHEHIVAVRWKNESAGKVGKSSRSQIVAWLDKDKSNTAYVSDDKGNKALVGTRHPKRGAAYLQTFADKTWTDNLLALPTFE